MMIRFLYVCLLRLHPRHFRQRFAEEMLWIFDQAAESRSAGPLLADASLSLIRQWALRSGVWERPAITGALAQGFDGVPVFYTCGSSVPRPGALLNGVVLSLAAFGAVYLAIVHGGSRRTLPAPMVGSHHLDNSSLFGLPGPAVSSPPAALRKLDKNHDGNLTPRGQGLGDTPEAMRLHPVLAALDADHSGEISASEIQNAPMALRTLDKNGDGKLTADEVLTDPCAH